MSNELKKELRKLKNLVKKYPRVNNDLIAKLEKLGYEKLCLGTGKQSYSCSKMVNVWELDNTYLKGCYIGVGCANIMYGKGNQYMAYVREIKNMEEC
jgi:hypothetical protein